MICLRCGKENPDDNNFCERCGTEFSNRALDANTQDVDPFELFFPKRKKKSKIAMTKDSTVCPQCRGFGRIQEQIQTLFGASVATKECPSCQGTGFIDSARDKN